MAQVLDSPAVHHEDDDRLPRRRFVVGSALLFSLPMLDAAFGAQGEALQFAFIAGAYVALAPPVSQALRDPRVSLALVGLLAVLGLGLGVGERLSFTAPDLEYAFRLALFSSTALLLGASAALNNSLRTSLCWGAAISGSIAGLLFALGKTGSAHHVEIGRSIAIGLTVLPFLYAGPRRHLFWRTAVLVTLMYLAIQNGARAPLVIAIIAIVVVLLLFQATMHRSRMERRYWRVAIGVLLGSTIIAIAGGFVQLDQLEGGAGRQAELLTARSLRDVSSFEYRIDLLYSPAVDIIKANITGGRGLPGDVSASGGYQYPHNFVLEMGIAFGVLGLAAALLAVLLGLRGAMRSAMIEPALSSLIIFAIINAQISDDIIGNRWVLMGAAFGLFFAREPSSPRPANRPLIPPPVSASPRIPPH